MIVFRLNLPSRRPRRSATVWISIRSIRVSLTTLRHRRIWNRTSWATLSSWRSSTNASDSSTTTKVPCRFILCGRAPTTQYIMQHIHRVKRVNPIPSSTRWQQFTTIWHWRSTTWVRQNCYERPTQIVSRPSRGWGMECGPSINASRLFRCCPRRLCPSTSISRWPTWTLWRNV